MLNFSLFKSHQFLGLQMSLVSVLEQVGKDKRQRLGQFRLVIHIIYKQQRAHSRALRNDVGRTNLML